MPATLTLETTNDLTVLDEKYAGIKDFMHPIFRELAERPEKELVEEIIGSLAPYSVDKGMSYDRELFWKTPDGVIEDSAENALILNRGSFISYIEHKYPSWEAAKDKVAFRFFDVKNFRDSDAVGPVGGDKSADVIVNRIGNRLYEKVLTVNDSLLKEGVNGNIAVCRYGGDEFILLFENLDDDLKERIWNFVSNEEDGIKSIEGYYMTDGKPVKTHVDLKDGFRDITVSKDPREAEIFWSHLQKGLILGEADIEKVMTSGSLTPEAYSVNRAMTMQEAVKRSFDLLQRHPEFDEVFEKLGRLEVKDREEQEKLLILMGEYIAGNLYDRLLGDYVSNISDFALHFMDKPYSRINVLDLKGGKEINDLISHSECDSAIVGMWEQVNSVLTNEDYGGSVSVYRKGTTLLVCEHDEGLSADVREKLLNIKGVKVGEGASAYSIATGSLDIPDDLKPVSTLEVRVVLDEAFRKTDSAWYREMVVNNLEHPEFFGVGADGLGGMDGLEGSDGSDDLEGSNSSEGSDGPHNGSYKNRSDKHIREHLADPENFIPAFLYGKRKNERTTALLAATDALLEDSSVSAEDKLKVEEIRNIVRASAVEG